MKIKDYFISKGYSRSTVKHYHQSVLNFLAWLDGQRIATEQVSRTDVTAYLQYLKHRKDQANSTRSVQLNIIRQYFDFEIRNGQRDQNPTRHIKIRGTKQRILYPIFSVQELDGIYANYQPPAENHKDKNKNWFWKFELGRKRNKAALGLLIYQGLTTAEVNQLKPADVNLREGKVKVEGGRKSKSRTLDLKPFQIMELMEYQLQTRAELIKHSETESEQLFISIGKYNDATNIWKPLTKTIKAQNTKFINFKQVRASVITHWLKQHNLRQVQYMAGHKYVSSTEAYKVNNLDDLKEDVEHFHPLGDD